MFHVGHLNLINLAKSYCDYLIVAVNSDDLVREYKSKVPVVCQDERKIIVANIKAVNQAEIADTLDKEIMLEQLKFDAIFIGNDWKNDTRWIATKETLKKKNVDVIFLPYTEDVSSTKRRVLVPEKIEEN